MPTINNVVEAPNMAVVSHATSSNMTKEKRAALGKIEALDLDPIVFSLVAKEDGAQWEIERARTAERWYRRFLFLVSAYPKQSIVPNKDVDAFWHQHILDTEKYFVDCDAIFGEYMHHYPYFGVKDEQDRSALEAAHSDTNQLYIEYFGEDPTNLKSQAAVCTQSCSQCTGVHQASVCTQSCSQCDHGKSSRAVVGSDDDPRKELSAKLYA